VSEIEKIIEGCQNRDRSAQKKLYEMFSPRLFAVCIRYSNNRVEAEDYLHEGFLKVFEKIHQFRNTGSIEAWMRRIMVNTIMAGYRKNTGISMVDETHIPVQYDMDEKTEDDIEEDNESDLKHVLDLVQELPERYKLVFNLFVLEDLSHEEIANNLGISIGTSKSNLSRARQWLKNRLSQKKTNNPKTVKAQW
jgi:RNA polymerase sigma factor (sigma-70 family)